MIRDDKERVALSLQLGIVKKLTRMQSLTGMSRSDIITMLILNCDYEHLLVCLDKDKLAQPKDSG